VAAVEGEIAAAVVGKDATDQQGLDEALVELDGTPNKSRLGANAILGCSVAAAKAAATEAGVPLYRWLGGDEAAVLPVPMLNVLNGGAHAQNSIDLQEFMVGPVGADSFAEAMRIASEVYPRAQEPAPRPWPVDRRRRRRRLRPRSLDVRGRDPGDPRGGRSRRSHREGGACARPGAEWSLPRRPLRAHEGGTRARHRRDDRHVRGARRPLPDHPPQDGLAEDEWEGWRLLTDTFGRRLELVGDDIFVTNVQRIQRGIDEGSANSVLIKLNQIGTVTETLEAIRLAHRDGWSTVVSHRSGETSDSTIAELAVAMNTGHLKSGAPCRGERLAKYNRLIEIEQELGQRAVYRGWHAFPRAGR
jgi:enolase